ncbi:uncharacterized protein MYCFIDRAFT_126382 [Pseudocercospora fijiensis CIRAD86]|uniref:BTB domain-containing protein n=1 Tax=Pseudocercospora fijiensis (strain CIRAD86) TaxID=383855 RepID=N1QCH1_PSEFD|nr:uncharacterized protein MYCFIDRAFT_126382 [Pseudocercospora fijiensis CIRAD86]EME89297.1 hypothetical protein MYCFIDRAFT_126382 [Pseudocercospora fijiensis CIRAD86]
MSSHLWKFFYEDDFASFERFLEGAAHNARPQVPRAAQQHGIGPLIGSPEHGLSPSLATRNRRVPTPKSPAGGAVALSKADINHRDALGRTLLHHAASSASESALAFATALIDHPYIDLYSQDLENGWTALHRAFYFGNITIARLILERDAGSAFGRTGHQVNQLVKVKDREGLGPLDLYAATIRDRTLRPVSRPRPGSDASDDDHAIGDSGDGDASDEPSKISFEEVNGSDLFSFGSGKNSNLGLGDQDDRQFPERINLRRPEHLLRRFFEDHLREHELKWSSHNPAYIPRAANTPGMWIEDIPWVVRSRPIVIQDVFMSKLHTAVLTTDGVSNMYICGHGQGGRLGTGDERTRFHFVCVEGGGLAGKRVATVALGQNHTLALTDDGDCYSWGQNGFGQLGYSLPKLPSEDEAISVLPRQIFGPLKRETVTGVAASRIHSVAHTSTSLFTFGKNEGQLGIVDSDARSLEMQTTPRKVAASLFAAPIAAACAIDRATICLLDNNDVWVFANYGYAKIAFPLDGFSNYFLKQSFLVTNYDSAPNRITKITAEGDNICAVSSRGEVFTLSIGQRVDNQASGSTSNPGKIRSAIGQPQRIWSPKKNNMAARDVALDTDGSIILSTAEGSVWKRSKRASPKDTTALGTAYKPKDYKFSRVPGLTRILAVRASGHGAYSAIRHDCDVLKTQVIVEDATLWNDMFSLLSLRGLARDDSDSDDMRPRFWQSNKKPSELSSMKKAIIGSVDIDVQLAALLETQKDVIDDTKCDAFLATTSSELKIPVHRFLLTARSRILRRGFRDLCETTTFTVEDLLRSELDIHGKLVVTFQGVDILTVVDLALYLYTDSLVDFWNFVRSAPRMAYSYRQVRAELMRIASKLELSLLEPAVRQMVEPRPGLDKDLEVAFLDPAFFHDGDILVQLEDDEIRVHSALVCARCPFFHGLFMGRAGGRWLAGRSNAEHVNVDLKHVSSSTFKLVLRHIYCDTGAELFDDVVSPSVDDFLDTVTDVMSCANELMLDRLSQISQQVIGHYVHARNVCGLLNAIAPCSVHEFKDAALDYICLNLEAMLQGHHLNELDPDLLEELDEVIRANQLASMPFAKSGRAELLLHERNPELAAAMDASRRRKIDTVTLRSKFQDMAIFAPGSFGEEISTSPTQSKNRRRSSQVVRHEVEHEQPSLKAKPSSKDMMFEMDEEFASSARSPQTSPSIRARNGVQALGTSLQDEESWFDNRGKALPSPKLAPQVAVSGSVTPRTPKSPEIAGKAHVVDPSKPWSLTPLSSKSAMKDIMAQAATTRTSSLTSGLANASKQLTQDVPKPFNLPAPKMSQKDRKRMMHSQQQGQVESLTLSGGTGSSPKPFSWQTVSAQKRPGLKDVLQSEASAADSKRAASRSPSAPQLTMRQTVANPKPSKSTMSTSKQQANSAAQSPSQPVPRSVRHQPIEEADWGLSMSEIVAQQQLEKDIIKEAVAPRDLQDIQAEQEFQEWWNKESARVQEAEQRAAAAAARASKKNRGRGGHSRGKGKKAGPADGNVKPADSKAQAEAAQPARQQ